MQYYKNGRGGGEVSVAHIADDNQKQNILMCYLFCLRILLNIKNKTNQSVTLVDIAIRIYSLLLQIRKYYKNGGVSVAHIVDDIQKQSKIFYLLYI